MSRHERTSSDDEPQPEAPDLGASVQLETEQQLVGPGGTDPLDAGYVPPDRPYGLDDEGVTAGEMRAGESVERRVARERDDEPVDPDRAGRLAPVDGADRYGEAVDVGVDGGAASAEEAAVHETVEPGAATEFEPSVADVPALDDPEVEAEIVADDPLAERARRQAARDARADGDRAAGLDADPDVSGSAAPASGSEDAGPDAWPR